MQAAFLSQLQAAATQAQTLLGESFTLGGTTYTGTLNETRATAELTAAGVHTVKLLEIAVTKTQFSAKPNPASRPSLTARGSVWTLTGGVGESELHYFLTAVPQ